MPHIADIILGIIPGSNSNPLDSTVEGNTFLAEMKCYNLPYGGIGFLSHILTFYTMIMISNGRKPLIPCAEITGGWWDAFTGLVSLGVTVGLSALTMVKCHHSWQLLLMGLWKMSIGIVSACLVIALAGSSDITAVLSIVPIFHMGLSVAGSVGLFSLVHLNWEVEHLKEVTIIFACVWGFCMVLILGAQCCSDEIPLWWSIYGIFGLFIAFGALYSDWALGLMAGNLWGNPEGKVAIIFWAYFAAKRLNMLSV